MAKYNTKHINLSLQTFFNRVLYNLDEGIFINFYEVNYV